jgi:hypothetical protein
MEITGVLLWLMINLVPWIIKCNTRNKIIIAERFIPDFVVMLDFTSKIKNYNMIKIIYFLERFTGIKPLYFHIFVDPQLALARKRDEYLTSSFCNIMISKYKYIDKYLRSVLIDTTTRKPFEAVNEVLQELEKRHMIRVDCHKR